MNHKINKEDLEIANEKDFEASDFHPLFDMKKHDEMEKEPSVLMEAYPSEIRLPLKEFEELQEEGIGSEVMLMVKGVIKRMDEKNVCVEMHEAAIVHGKVLTAKERSNLSGKDFALPGKRAYPIHDKAHARNALARVSQFGSVSEKAKVRAAVRRKFPDIGEASRAVFGHGGH